MHAHGETVNTHAESARERQWWSKGKTRAWRAAHHDGLLRRLGLLLHALAHGEPVGLGVLGDGLAVLVAVGHVWTRLAIRDQRVDRHAEQQMRSLVAQSC